MTKNWYNQIPHPEEHMVNDHGRDTIRCMKAAIFSGMLNYIMKLVI